MHAWGSLVVQSLYARELSIRWAPVYPPSFLRMSGNIWVSGEKPRGRQV